MTDKKIEAKMYVLHKMCDCGGEFFKTNDGTIFMSNGFSPQTLYKCNKCGKSEYIDGNYPALIYEEVTK